MMTFFQTQLLLTIPKSSYGIERLPAELYFTIVLRVNMSQLIRESKTSRLFLLILRSCGEFAVRGRSAATTS